MPQQARFVRRQLTGKFGFEQSEGANHEKFRLTYKGQYVAQTMMSRGIRDISDQILGQMARQIGVTSREFRAMLECTIDRQTYIESASQE